VFRSNRLIPRFPLSLHLWFHQIFNRISQQFNLPAETFSRSTSNQAYWITIDPTGNFHRDFEFTTNPLLFNISGKTNLPAGSKLWVNVYPCNRNSSHLIVDFVAVEQTTDGNNTFSYPVNITKTAAGERIITTEYCTLVKLDNVKNIIRFNLTVEDPPFWIRIDPVAEYHRGKNFTITGTTNLPAGSEITVTCGFFSRFPCPMWAEDDPYNWSGTVCGNEGCEPGHFSWTIPVKQGTGQNNIWMVSDDTTGWCENESYRINVVKKGLDNVSPASIDFRFQE